MNLSETGHKIEFIQISGWLKHRKQIRFLQSKGKKLNQQNSDLNMHNGFILIFSGKKSSEKIKEIR